MWITNRWLWIFFFVLLLSVIALQSWLGGIRKERLLEETILVERVHAKFPLESVSQVEHFHGEQKWTVIWAQSKSKVPVVAWINDQTIQIEPNPLFASRESVQSEFIQSHPTAQLIRLTPGIVRGKKIWEIYYRIDETMKNRFGYSYYDWKTGQRIDQYHLAALEK